MIEFLELLWFELVLQIRTYVVCFLAFIYLSPINAQLSDFQKAESFFYDKQYAEAKKLYNNILKNENASKKEIAFSKCRISLLSNDIKELSQNQSYLEEALSDNLLSPSMISVCSYGLLQIYNITKKYEKSIELSRVLGSPKLEPIYLARYYALSAQAARYTFNKEFERLQLGKLLEIMKKENLNKIQINNYSNYTIIQSDIIERLSMLNFDNNMDNNFQNNFIENALLINIRAGNYEKSLDIIEKNIFKNAENFILSDSFEVNKIQLRSRLLKLINDNPQEMRVGIVLANRNDRQEYNQNFLRGISAFLASSAAIGVHYTVEIEEANRDEGSLSEAAIKLIFNKNVHVLVIAEGFNEQDDLVNLANLFSIPLVFPRKNSENIFSQKYANDINSLNMISENGNFRNSFEKILNAKIDNLSIEAKVFDAFILFRNLQYIANGSQSAQLEKIITNDNWKINGVSIYEGIRNIKGLK